MNTRGRPVHPRRTGSLRSERLRPRDMEVLRWACEQYGARGDHVAELLGGRHARTAERVMVRLREFGYADLRRYMFGEPPWMIPTHRGLRVFGMTSHKMTPSVGRLAHYAAVNEVRLYIQRRTPETLWVPERQIAMESKAGHRPDGIAIVEGLQAAIEVERAARQPFLVAGIVAELERRYDAVVYFCAPAPHLQLSKLAASGRFPKLEVRDLSKLAESEAREGVR